MIQIVAVDSNTIGEWGVGGLVPLTPSIVCEHIEEEVSKIKRLQFMVGGYQVMVPLSSNEYHPENQSENNIGRYRPESSIKYIRDLIELFDSEYQKALSQSEEIRREARVKLRDMPDSRLQDALEELLNIDEESKEEGFELCSDKTKKIAERVLRAVYKERPFAYSVFPTPEREICIDVSGKLGHGVLIVCGPEKGAACFVTRAGENDRVRYDNADKIPDAFTLKALLALEVD